MVTLPSPESIVPNDRLPRRMGVGSWQPEDIARGGQALEQGANQAKQGFEQSGEGFIRESMGLEREGQEDLAAGREVGQGISTAATDFQQQIQQQNNMALTNGENQYKLLNMGTDEQLKQTTDPDKVAAVGGQYASNVDTVAASLPAGLQQQFRNNAALTLNGNLYKTQDYHRGLVGEAAKASYSDTADGLISGAAQMNDDKASGAALDGVNAQLTQMQAAGYITPMERSSMSAAASTQYIEARDRYLRADADARAAAGQPGAYDRYKAFVGTMPQVEGAYQPQGQGPVNMGIPPEGRALLQTIGGPESGMVYNKMYGGALFNNGYADHPRTPQTANGVTASVAGAYQFQPGTWDMEARKLGLTNFTPANQDVAAWDLAQTTYRNYTRGGDLLTALRSNNPAIINGVTNALKSQWSSLPGGGESQENAGQFGAKLAANMSFQQGNGQASGIRNPSGGAFVGRPPPELPPGDQFAGPGVPTMPVQVQPPGYIAPQGAATTPIQPNVGSGAGGQYGPSIATPQPGQPGMEAYDKDGNYVGAPGAAPGGVTKGTPAGYIPNNGGFVPANSNTTSLPPKKNWPDGVGYTAITNDGSGVYVMKDGSVQPIPGSRATGATSLPIPNGPTGSVFDHLHPQQAAEMKLSAQQFIDAGERKQQAQQVQDENRTGQYLKGVQKSIVNGTDGLVTDDVWAQNRRAYSNSPSPNVRAAFATADAIRNQIHAYAGSTPGTVAQNISEMTAQLQQAIASRPDDPGNQTAAAVLDASQAYLKKYQLDIQRDPFGRAAAQGILARPPTTIDPSSPNVEDQMRERMADAQIVGQKFGQTPQFFTKDERAGIRQIEMAGGPPMTDFAAHVVNAAGPAAGTILKQIGSKGADDLQWIGQNQLVGGEPEASDAVARYSTAVRDPEKARDLPLFGKATFNDKSLAVTRPTAPVDTTSPPATIGLGTNGQAAVESAAAKLMTMAAFDGGFDPKDANTKSQVNQAFVNKYYTQALGGSVDENNVQWGGVSAPIGKGSWYNVGGSNGYKTIVPNNIRADQFETVLGAVKNDDVANGMQRQPVDAANKPLAWDQIKDGQLRAVPDANTGVFNGSYVVMKQNLSGKSEPVMASDGKPFVLDMRKMDMSQRVPGAYKPGSTGPQTQPPVNPSRNVHGIMTAEEGSTLTSGEMLADREQAANTRESAADERESNLNQREQNLGAAGAASPNEE